MDIDRLAAARFGLNIGDVQDVVSTTVGGKNVAQSVEGLERYPINIRYPQEVRDSVARLRDLPLVTATGARISLGEVVEVRVESGPGLLCERGPGAGLP